MICPTGKISRRVLPRSSWPGKSAKRVFALDGPAIHVFVSDKEKQDVDHRVKPGDDSSFVVPLHPITISVILRDGYPVRGGLSILSLASLEYWITRFRG